MKEIPLTQDKVTIVDDEDYDRLIQYKWSVMTVKGGNLFYAQRSVQVGNRRHILLMHREILGFIKGDGKTVDHLNRNGLDNRRENLRDVTHSLNSYNKKMQSNNTSGYRGVKWCVPLEKWHAGIQVNKKQIHRGYYANIIDAAKAYDQAALHYWKEKAILNFPL